jgi:hypothetical protein
MVKLVEKKYKMPEAKMHGLRIKVTVGTDMNIDSR